MNLLPLPGGGCFGAFQAAVLAKVPDEYKKRIGSVAGTSVGSVAALALALHVDDRLLDFFSTRAPRIFSHYRLRHYLKWPLPRYNDAELCEHLKDLFGNVPFGECRKPTWITAVRSTGRPKVYFSGDAVDGMLPAWEVARASCGAPTYFRRWHGKSDGGLVANNPVLVGLAGLVRDCGYSIDQLRAIKLGTGYNGDLKEVEHGSGPRTWMGNMFFAMDALFEGASDVMNDTIADAFLGRRYMIADFKLRGDLRHMSMDNPETSKIILRDYERDIEQAAIDLVRFLAFPTLDQREHPSFLCP